MAPSIHAPRTRPAVSSGLGKAPTGIRGFDEITGGGLPRGRASLVTGGPGAGKTLFGLEFLARGAQDYDEPGVLLAFEESAAELADDVASLGLDLAGLEASGDLVVDACRVDATDFVTTGEFDLDGLFIRLSAAVQATGARRVVLDTIEVLFGALDNEAVVRAEFSRLLRWLKDQGLTTLITGERGREGQLTRYGIEEYVSDCVIVLDHRMHDEIATRRLRIVKYRGSGHGTNEYPFLVTDRGLMVWPITSTQLTYPVSTDRISLGVPRLDEMLTGGVHRGSTVLITGTAGTGKTTLAAAAVDAACARGEPALFVSFEESPDQLVRNMRSVGIDLGRWVDAGLLRLWGQRATAFGLESHLAAIERLLDETTPAIAVLDAVGSLTHVGAQSEVTAAVAREVDMMKSRGITGVLTSLSHEGQAETSSVDASSLIDTWLLLRNVESDGERNRLLFVIKSRGTAHSNQVREFILTDHGAELLDVSVGPRGVLTGSARMAQVAEERAAEAEQSAELERRRLALARRSAEVEAQIAVLREQLATETAALDRLVAEESRGGDARAAVRATLARRRQGGRDAPPPAGREG
ncbi:circadian clock protein KaiC [Geodermatophilus sabuli]|uniref:Circadian clock protein KaiC n=1 Tax=Geodermatophilus sabuli TaxID=1564158 RepID=A0A285E573_9ACTN|nr:circadian clock protein KaiC [Geodermatophilus sabuli]MBB3082897.1 circadian clock protein KaiC [Geodermatophilus sabuli]SNX94238.1 circadian clock protein KaiC [Geodermatophilus sabuli]